MLLALLVVSSFAAPIPESAKKPGLYFPVKKGAKWVYSVCGENLQEGELVCEVTDVKDGNNGAKNVMVSGINKVVSSPMDEWEVSDRGVFLIVRIDDKPTISTDCYLKLPHKHGQSWPFDSAGTKELTAYGPEKLKTPAGEYDAIRVEHRVDQSPQPNRTHWYAPGVGPVKIEEGKELLMVLKSFRPGKD